MRLLLLIPAILWVWPDDTAPWLPATAGSAGMWIGIAAVVLMAMVWGQWAARRGDARALRRALDGVGVARIAVTLLMIFGLTVGGWRELLQAFSPNAQGGTPHSLGLLLALSPQLLAWLGLWAAAYPSVRAVREMHALDLLLADRPVTQMPSVGRYVLQQARPSLGLTLVPLLMIFLVQDVLRATGLVDAAGWSLSLSAIAVFVAGPWVLVRLLPTATLPHGPTRDALHHLALTCGLPKVPVRLWKTDHTIANAAVLGLVPGLRTVLLSDLLLATMPLEHVRAVLAHEFGHIKRRHILWYAVFVMAIMAALSGPLSAPTLALESSGVAGQWASVVLGATVLIGGFLLLMRRFEREADLYAAIVITPPGGNLDGRTFARALEHVAMLNGMETQGRRSLVQRVMHQFANATHGTIESRQRAVLSFAVNRRHVNRFMVTTALIKLSMLAVLVGSVAWMVVP